MVKCEYCGDPVTLPFTCSLCGEKFCVKHRLPENHECLNLYKFQTDEYRKQKVQMRAELQQQIYVPQEPPQIDRLRLDNSSYWSAKNQLRNVLYLGLLLTLVNYLQSIMLIAFNFVFFVYFILAGIVIGVFGSMTVFYARSYATYPHKSEPSYAFWKIGVAITLVTAIITGFLNGEFFLFYLPGFFIPMNFLDDRKNKLSVFITTFAYFIVGFTFYFLIGALPYSSLMIYAVVLQLTQMAVAFILLGILNLIVEGRVLYRSSKLLFIITVIFAIFSYFFIIIR